VAEAPDAPKGDELLGVVEDADVPKGDVFALVSVLPVKLAEFPKLGLEPPAVAGPFSHGGLLLPVGEELVFPNGGGFPFELPALAPPKGIPFAPAGLVPPNGVPFRSGSGFFSITVASIGSSAFVAEKPLVLGESIVARVSKSDLLRGNISCWNLTIKSAVSLVLF
jgi:hypothetical protein